METNTSQDNQRQAILLSYLAGIIDGEGCIRIKKNTQRGTQQCQYHTTISVGMTDERIPQILCERFGGKVRVELMKTSRNLYRWQLENRALAIEALKQLEPLLIVKREQALLALEFENKYCRLNTFSAKTVATKTEFDLSGYYSQIQLREDFYLRMKKLNAVGAAATTNRENTREGEVIV